MARRFLPASPAATALAALVLAGCSTVGPDYQRPPAQVPTAYRSATVAPAPDAASVTNTAWWKGFGDPELDGLIESALDNNRDLKLALARIREFQARVEVSKAADKPQVGYGLTGNRTRRSQEQPDQFQLTTSPEFNAFQLGLNFSWEYDLWGKIKRANEAALADLLASEADQRAVMLTVVTSVATQYVQLLGLDQELATAKDAVKNRRDALAVFEARYKGGQTTQIQVEKARAEAEAAETVIPDIERRIATTENALNLLAGRAPGEARRRRLEALAMPGVPADLPSDLLNRRPDVMQAEQALVAANARIGVAQAEFLPTVSLTGALGLASDQLRWLFSKTARAGEFTRGLAGAAYSGGRIEGNVKAAEAVRDQAAETYLKAVQTGLQEVDDALVTRVKAIEQGQALGRQVATVQGVVKIADKRVAGGQSTRLEKLDAELDLLKAQGLAAQARRDEFVALVSIYKAMGGGWMVEQNKLREARVAPIQGRTP